MLSYRFRELLPNPVLHTIEELYVTYLSARQERPRSLDKLLIESGFFTWSLEYICNSSIVLYLFDNDMLKLTRDDGDQRPHWPVSPRETPKFAVVGLDVVIRTLPQPKHRQVVRPDLSEPV